LRIAVDVMGGDDAPDAILDGCVMAVDQLGDEHTLVLVGDEAIIREGLAEAGLGKDGRIEIVGSTDDIGMGESPVTALRSKPDSSIVKLATLGGRRAGDDKCDVIISAGNTGACVAAAQMSMRRLPGVHRPGIAVTMPTFHGPVMLCDVGANPEPRAAHLHQYAHMTAVFAERILGIENPRVGLMNIGGEEGKGTPLVKETNRLCRWDQRLNYVGNVEGRDLFAGTVDIVVTEGFTGNVVLKLSEALAKGIFQVIAHEVFEEDPELAMQFEPIVKKIWKKHDYHEYGGAPLLGANGLCYICHGSSEPRTIAAAIRVAIQQAQTSVNDAISERLLAVEADLEAAGLRGEPA
jgi:glycerol-3-phosphate acyltransferase PlsX